MARRSTGWVKSYRKTMFGSLTGDGHSQAILGLLVWMAGWESCESYLRRQKVKLKRGELATGLDELVRETGFTRRIVIGRLKKLEKLGSIEQRVSPFGRIIFVCNYDKYQGDDTGGDTGGDTAGDTGSDTGAGTTWDTHVKNKEQRTKNKIPSESSLPPMEKAPPKAKKAKVRITDWVTDDPFAKAFENLKAFPKYWAIFDLEKERKTLLDHMDHHKLSIDHMADVTRELRLWIDGPNHDEVKSPRGTLATFVRNFAARLAKQPKKNEPTMFRGDPNELV